MNNNNYLSLAQISKMDNIDIQVLINEITNKNLFHIKKDTKILIPIDSYLQWKKLQNWDLTSPKKNINNYKFVDIEKEHKNSPTTIKQIKTTKNSIKFADFFSGAGGLSLGFTMANFKSIASVEFLKSAVNTFNRNFYSNNLIDEKVEPLNIKDKKAMEIIVQKCINEKIEVIVGGFPCQGFSIAGNRIVTDPRNSLYLDLLEIIKKVKPKIIVLENVPGLKSMLNGKIKDKIIDDFEEIGYNISLKVLCAADYGVPQLRKRLIFIGNIINKTNLYPKPYLNTDTYITVEKAIKKYININQNAKINHIFTSHKEKTLDKIKTLKEGESLFKNYRDGWKKIFWNKPSNTIKENHGGVNIHPKLNRVLTPRELAALQSFPDDFIFEGAKKWQLVQIGNAVPPLFAKAIALGIRKMLDK